jgi:hypothetical protein
MDLNGSVGFLTRGIAIVGRSKNTKPGQLLEPTGFVRS